MRRSKKNRPIQIKLKSKRFWFQVIVIAVAVAVLWPQLQAFLGQESLQKIKLVPLLTAYALFMCSVYYAGMVYRILLPQPLPLGRTILVQTAAGFTNRLLPSGLGAIGINTFYLAKQCRIKKLQAAAIATTNNAVGFLAFALLFIVATGTSFLSLDTLTLIWREPLWVFVVLLSALLALLIVNGVRGWKRGLERASQLIIRTLRNLASSPLRLLLAIIASCGITLCHIGALALCADSIGYYLSFSEVMLVLGAGIGATALSPTPNGLGATELLMTFSLTAVGVATPTALVIVLMYRIATFWLPIVPGIIAFRVLLKQKVL